MGQTEIMRNALKVLGALINANAMVGHSISSREVLEATGLAEDEYWPADLFLLQQKYIGGGGGGLNGKRWLEGEGIEFYERSTNPTPTIQVGAIFQGPIEGSQIQAFATAVNSSVQQAVQNTAPNDMRDVICKTVEDMVQVVKAELNLDELASYIKLAKELQQEVTKDTPNKSALHRLLASLSFFGDLEGTLEFGGRALRLAQLVLPYVPIIIGYLNQL